MFAHVTTGSLFRSFLFPCALQWTRCVWCAASLSTATVWAAVTIAQCACPAVCACARSLTTNGARCARWAVFAPSLVSPPPTLLACCSPRVGTSSYCQVRCCLLLRALRLCNHWRAQCEALPSVMFSPPLLVSLPRALGWESLLPIAFLHTHPGEPLFRLE